MSGRGGLLALLVCAASFATACQTQAGELSGLAEGPPLDYAVLVTGGAFLTADATHVGTFVTPEEAANHGTPGGPAAASEPIPMASVLEALTNGRVFQRVEVDADDEHRRDVRGRLRERTPAPELQQFLQDARNRGFDLLVVVEELQDGPIEVQGINGRWPVTFATWILLGVGMFIPDHTFESRALLRITVRDLQTGGVLYDGRLAGGPIDLSLTERGAVLGIVVSIIVPPFWVGSDRESLASSVRAVTRQRLLLSLARDLKSESVRQRLREGGAASLLVVDRGTGPELVVDAGDSLSSVRLRCEPPLAAEELRLFQQALLSSMRAEGGRFRYHAPLPAAARGRLLQVLAATIRGNVASATFAPGGDK